MILITGAPGWLGTRLVDTIVNGSAGMPWLTEPYADRRIRCFVFNGVNSEELRGSSRKLSVVEGDVRDRASVEPLFRDAEGATLFHLIGVIHPRRVRDFYDVNTGGARNVVDCAVEYGVERMVMISSNSPAGHHTGNGRLFDENSPNRPYMSYGKSKMLAEDFVNAAHASGKLEATILRPCWFYGPGQPPRQTRFFKMIQNGRVPVVGGGENRRSMTYIDNLCQAILLAGHIEKARGQTYWIADRKPYTMNETVDMIERLLEHEFNLPVAHRRMRLPGIASEFAVACDWIIQRAGLYWQEMHVLSEMNKTIACSIEKAERELGYCPRIGLEEGMRRSIRWCIDRGFLP